MTKPPMGKEVELAFPLDALPEWLGVYVSDVARTLQVPVDMPAACALGLLGVAGARLADVNPFADHLEPLNLFVALIAPPGQKKSACLSAFFKPVDVFERRLQLQQAPTRRLAALQRERLEHELEAAKRAGEWSTAEALSAELDGAPRPVEPRLTTADVTAQRLAGLLAEHRCMAVVSAEPAVIPTMLGRWANGKATTELDVFLQGHAGDAIKVDRQGRPSERVENPRLSLVVMLQPEALRSLSNAETAGRGLLARFLYVDAPDVRGSARLRDGAPVPSEHRAAFEAGLEALLSAKPLVAPLRFDAEATNAWVDFCDTFERRLAPAGDMRDFHGWGEKFRGHVARIAGGLHLANAHGSEPVSATTLGNAIAIGRWLEGHARHAFVRMNLNAEVREANVILEVIIREEWLTTTRRQLHQKLRNRTGFKQSRDLERGLDALVRASWLTPRTTKSSDRGGRPSMVFDVHAEVHSEGFEGLSGGLKWT